MSAVDFLKPWYYGSPLRITVIKAGSTITQDRSLARIFSHGPTFVSMDEGEIVKHNGKEEGFLYLVADKVGSDNLIPHPEPSLEGGKEWLTIQPIKIHLIGPTKIVRGEVLSEIEISMLMNILEGQKRQEGSRTV